MISPERGPTKHGDRRLLHRALDHLGFLPVILPPPLRLAPHVHHDAAHRADVPCARLPGAGLLVPLAARLRDPPPRAPRLQRHGAGPARPGLLRQRAHHDVDDRRALQRPPGGDVVTRAALPRQLSRLALARPRRLDLGGSRRRGGSSCSSPSTGSSDPCTARSSTGAATATAIATSGPTTPRGTSCPSTSSPWASSSRTTTTAPRAASTSPGAASSSTRPTR